MKVTLLHFSLLMAIASVMLAGCSSSCHCPDRPVGSTTVVTPPLSSTTIVTPDQ